VDASAGMLAQARRQLWRHGLKAHRVEFIHADILSWVPLQNHYDLVVTNFFSIAFALISWNKSLPGSQPACCPARFG
jgi:hypothetical protein